MEYGLIGAKLGHSFSKIIHEQLGGYYYELRELPTPEAFAAFMEKREFKAINVTIPYKKAVIPYCEALDACASAVGAVNTIVNRDGHLYGHNTDYGGFLYLANRMGVSFAGKKVLILGTGGTQKTAQAVVRDAGAARVDSVSRSGREGALTYARAMQLTDTEILINTTPCGMYPDNDGCPIVPAAFPYLEAVLDVVYNPLRTRLVESARARGIRASGGLPMLVAQAKLASEIFRRWHIADSEIARVLYEVRQSMTNLVLIGMPSSGKTSFGQAAAQQLRRPFLDLDAEIERLSGKTIPELFAERGEAAFRALESQACAEAGKRTGCVIATGGGAVLREENVRALRQNGLLVYLDRPLEALQVGGNRPLSVSLPALADLKNERAPLYLGAADARVLNNRDAALVLADILSVFKGGTA